MKPHPGTREPGRRRLQVGVGLRRESRPQTTGTELEPDSRCLGPGAGFLAHAFFCNLESLYWKRRERQRERTVCHFRRGAGKEKQF